MGDRKWNLKEALDILVTVSEELNIMIPANEVGPAVYIDIPLNAVSEVACENALIPDSQQPIYGLVLRLNGGETTNCILNATGYAESHVAFAFSSEKDANTLRRLLMPTNFRANGSAPHDRSVATDASERILSDDELAAPGPGLSDNRMLSGTALQNHAIDFHGNAISTIDPSMLERVRPPQSASPDHQHSPSNLVPEYDEDRLLVGHNVEMAAEGIDVSQTDIPQKDGLVEQAIEGIDVSQIDGSSQGDLTRQDVQSNVSGDASFNARVQDSQVLDKWNQDFAGRSNRPRDIRMSSSLRLNTGLDAVENVPQSHTRSSQKIASSIEYVENRRGLPDQDGEYNNLYYASPRITKDHHKSPRILAKESVSRARERPSETTVRQASAEKVPPVKLSRQTRNAEGVAEVHTEQTADDGLTTMAKNHAVDVKASGNNSKGMASDPGKEKKRMQGVTAHGRKIAQTRGKAVANEELQGNSLGGDNEKAAKTWLKAKKAPHDNKKKARSVLTRAPNAASSRGYASELRDSSDSDPRASEPLQGSLRDRPNDKNVDDDDDAIWDIDQAYDEEECQTPRRLYRSAKKEKKQAVHMSKTEQTKSLTQLHSKKAKAKRPAATLNQKPLGRLAEAKPAPAPLTRSRPRRTAAIKANKKIQGLERSEDESVEDEGPVSAPTRSKLPSIAARRRKDQVVRNGGDDRPLSSTKIPTKKRYPKDFIPDSISPNSSDKGELNSRSDPRADSSSDKVILVKDASAKTLRAAASDKRNDLRKEVPTSGVETSAILLHPGHGEHPNHVDDISAEHGARDNFAHLREPIIATETAHINFQRDNDIPQATNDLNATSGLVIQDSVQDVAPCTDDELLERELHTVRLEEKVASSQAPKVLKTVQTRKTRSPLRPTESAEKSPPKPTSTRQDPFASKLNASMAQAKDTNPQTRSSKVSGFPELKSKAPNTSKLTEPGKSLQEYEATTIETSGAPSSGEAKHVKSAQKLVKSSMQVDDEDKGSLGRSSKRAGEKSSASVPKTKRKIEQARDTTNKKVKVTPNERLEGVLARNPGFNAEKTPPPVLNNKPLLIGFSASGPRNQGTISTKKSKNVKHVGTGASDQVESREHQVSNAEIDQVQADFTSNKEVLEPTSAVIQASVKVPGIAQQRDHASPWQKQHHEVVSAGATGEEQLHEKGPAKRKLASSVDDPAPFEHEQLSKRQKRDSRTPPTAQNHHPKMLPDVYPTLVHDRPHRLSSQNTRVNENGSPMPFFVNCEEGREALDQYSDVEDVKDALAEARLEEQAVLQNDELVISEPILPLVPLVSATSASNSKPKAYQSLSNNNKQLPSSPHACSAFGTMQPHHLYHDGKIVNAETKEFIVPNEPQDPFLSASQKPPNAFMDALRRSTVSAAKSPVPGANDKRDSGGMIMRQNVDVGEDPDKTLVEPHMKKRHKRVQVSETSSSPESGSSTQASPPNEASEEESEPETEVRWRKGLEPYQDNMLECLLTISHVSSDLRIPQAMH